MSAVRGGPQHDGVVAGSGFVVLVSYSREDARWTQRFVTMLEPERRGFGIEVWVDTAIATGQEWRPEIEAAIARADGLRVDELGPGDRAHAALDWLAAATDAGCSCSTTSSLPSSWKACCHAASAAGCS